MKKIIGVCTTKVNEELSRNYLSRLHAAAEEKDYSVAVFHSIYDFYRSDAENGARQVFKMLPYDMLSALVIMRDCIYNEELLEMIVSDASAHNVPLIMIRGTDERCHSIIGDSSAAYEELVRSVIENQGISDTFFIAGRRTSDPDSEQRISVYRKVLEECGYEYNEDNIAYGGYWETPAAEAAKKLTAGGKKPPRAVFCANDIMAFTVMKSLLKEGYRIPEDVIVTGFDGLEHSIYCIPSLSTCQEDIDALAVLTVETAEKLSAGREVPAVQTYPYRAMIAESSDAAAASSFERKGTGIFYRMRVDEVDEDASNGWINVVLNEPGMANLRRFLPAMVSENYSIGIRTNAFFDENSMKTAPDSYLVMQQNGRAQTEKLISSENIIEAMLERITPGKAMYISMISKDDYIYGIACSESDEIAYKSGKTNRFVQTLNRALLASISCERLLRKAAEEYGTKYMDALTGLYNNDGANKWFEDITAGETVHQSQMTIGVYTFINYEHILNTYGMQVLEDDVQFMGKALKLANPEDAVVARISADSFAVMIGHEPGTYFGDAVDNIISLFYGFLDTKNKKTPDITGMEVSCGYTDVVPPWQGKLSDYLNAATSTMYKNRMSFIRSTPRELDTSDGAKVLEYQTKLLSLLNENLFNYHFQPIVDARNGNVVAYEALMRTGGNINMSPLEVLAAAGMYSKLSNIEYATFFNVLCRFAAEREKFSGKKVFINTIPGYFLSNEHCDILFEEYGDLLSDVVVEITESQTITVEELDSIRSFGTHNSNIRIAVDDYGAGHSNIVNLIEYRPEIVKIDRYLISNINTDRNKQMFVKNLIEFAGENNIRVLAEGVETREELETVIDFGVDLIQGYYTCRPSAEIISEIDPEIKKQITDRRK